MTAMTNAEILGAMGDAASKLDMHEYHKEAGDMEKAIAAVAELIKRDEWQDIATAPRDGSEILAANYGDDISSPVVWRDGSENHWKMAGFYFSDDYRLTSKPCRFQIWRDLPPPPPNSTDIKGGEDGQD